MKTFYLIRHGDKLKIPGDPPLSDLGNKQAILTAKYLKSLSISKVISSPILRTFQTAEHITKAIGIKVETNDLLKERVNWGDDPSQSFDDFLKMWVRSSEERKWQPPVGDSSYNCGKRLQKLIENLMMSFDYHIVFVTHGGIISDFLRNIFPSEELNRFIPNFVTPLDDNVKECSITVIKKGQNESEFKLIGLANTDHLSEI